MTYLHNLTLPEVLAEWDRLDDNGSNLPAMRALCLIDRYYLLIKVMKRVDMLHEWIYARCREVEADPDGYLDLWAREHYKSTIITFAGAIQEIIKNPEITIGIFSHTKDIAGDFLAQIKREFETNELLQKAFPDILYQNTSEALPGTWNLARLTVKRKTNPKEATVEAHGLVEGMPTGKHFELMIYDDVVVPASVSTPEQIHKTTSAWELSDNLGARSANGFTRKWHIGTRYSYADTYDVMIKRAVVKTRIYPATEDGTMYGKPVLLTDEQWKLKVQTQGQATIACQMLQDPLSGTDRMFDRKDLQVYEVRPHTLNVYILVDPARSMKKGSDNTAIAVIGVDASLNLYLLDGINHRCSLLDRYNWTKMLYNKWVNSPGVQAVFVGYEKYGALADLDYFYSQMKLPNEPSFIIKELASPTGMGNASKEDRVQRLDPDLRRHKIFLPYPTTAKTLTSHQKKILNMKEEELKRLSMSENDYMKNTSAKMQTYRLSKAIIRKDSEGQIYDLSEQLVTQFHYFPHGGKVDLIDAFSRIYDMEIAPPVVQDYSTWKLEPEMPW
jgi:hypothetical protein